MKIEIKLELDDNATLGEFYYIFDRLKYRIVNARMPSRDDNKLNQISIRSDNGNDVQIGTWKITK